MKILVLCSNYPDKNGSTSGMFFHVRNLYYSKNGAEVDVLYFGSKVNYKKDGINVFTYETYKNKLKNNKYDILICHAPHISHHYIFLKKYSNLYSNIVFVFHGNEVFKVNKILPKEYPFRKRNNQIKKVMRDIKDEIKLFLWKRVFTKIVKKSHFIFVSNWMREQFLRFTKIDNDLVKERSHIIYNSIGKPFEVEDYDEDKPKDYDFITIRNNLDGAKYGIEIVNELAKSNPGYQFLVIGKGDFFNYYEKARNIESIQDEFSHEEILSYLNKSRCGLLPTLWDSQGLMTCEFASFGIPTITSDIPICHEILDDFKNVAFIDNENTDIDLSQILNQLTENIPYPKNNKYFAEFTSGEEMKLFKLIINGSKI